MNSAEKKGQERTKSRNRLIMQMVGLSVITRLAILVLDYTFYYEHHQEHTFFVLLALLIVNCTVLIVHHQRKIIKLLEDRSNADEDTKTEDSQAQN